MGQDNRLQSLTGLRFLAVLLVFLQHIQGHFGIPEMGLDFGHEATILFFVLSGFVLTVAYQSGFAEPGRLREYFFARWSRIWPVHALTLLIAVGLLWSQSDFFARPDWPALLLANLLLLQSWVPLDAWIMSFNSVSWFLSVLVLGYVVFPLFVKDGKRTGLMLGIWFALLLLAFILLSNLLSAQWNQTQQNIALFHPLVRGWEFLLGVGLGQVYLDRNPSPVRSEPRFRTLEEASTTGQFVEGTDIDDLKVVRASRESWDLQAIPDRPLDVSSGDTALQLVVLLMVGAYLASLLFLEWDAALIAEQAIGPMIGIAIRSLGALVIVAGLVWAFASPNGAFSPLLSSPPLRYLGEIAFAFFMTHQLVIRGLDRLGWHTELPGVAIAGLLCLLSLAVAMLIHHLFELPCRVLLTALEQRVNQSTLPNRVAWRETLLAAREAGGRFLAGLKAPTALISLVALLFLGAAVYGSYSPPPQPVNRPEYVARPFFGKAEIRFQEEAILHAIQVDRIDQGIRLTMFWERLPSARRNRSFHLIDASGQIIGYAQQDQPAFQAKVPGTVFQEPLVIPEKDLGRVAKIGIGFFHPEHKGAPISRGPRGLNGRRLEIDLSRLP